MRVSKGFQALHFLKVTRGELGRWPSLKQRLQPVTGCNLPLGRLGRVPRVTADRQPAGEPGACGRGRRCPRGCWSAGPRGSMARELCVPGRSQWRMLDPLAEGEGHGPRSRGRHERERQRPRGPRPPHPSRSGVAGVGLRCQKAGRAQTADASNAPGGLRSVVSYAAARPDPTDGDSHPTLMDTAHPSASGCLGHLVPRRLSH